MCRNSPRATRRLASAGVKSDRRALFEDWSESYDPAADDAFPFGSYDQVLDRVAELVAARAPRRVLELGLGTGNLTRRILGRLPDVSIVGVDFSPAMAGSVASELPAVELVIHDLASLPLPDEAAGCDVAAMTYVLHEFADDYKLRLLSALVDDTLSPDGACVIGDVCFRDVTARDAARQRLADRWDPDEHYMAAEELTAAAGERGLRLEVEQLGSHAGVLTAERRLVDG